MELFVEIFHYDFMVRAFVSGLILAIIAPIVGVFLVVRRYSLLADALSHVSLAGAAIGILLHLPSTITALVASAASAIGIERMRRGRKIFGESVLAVFLSGSLAIAVVLMGLAKGFNAGLLRMLFGSVATVSFADMSVLAVIGLLTGAFFLVFYKQLVLIALDEDLAFTSGVAVDRLNIASVMAAAFVTALAMPMVGALLIGALMVIPSLASMRIARSFRQTIGFAVFFSVLSVITGLIVSYAFDIASGGAIVLVALGIFLLCGFFEEKSR